MPVGFKPIMVKDAFEGRWLTRTERWNSYSRDRRLSAERGRPVSVGSVADDARWHPYPGRQGSTSTALPAPSCITSTALASPIDFLKYDLVNLAYHLPGIDKSAVIGVGGGRDLLSAHLFGVTDITGVELNHIFIDLHTRHPVFAPFSNLLAGARPDTPR